MKLWRCSTLIHPRPWLKNLAPPAAGRCCRAASPTLLPGCPLWPPPYPRTPTPNLPWPGAYNLRSSSDARRAWPSAARPPGSRPHRNLGLELCRITLSLARHHVRPLIGEPRFTTCPKDWDHPNTVHRPARAAGLPRVRMPGGPLTGEGIGPADCQRGLERLEIIPSPPAIEPQRWATYVTTVARLPRQRSPALQKAGWRTLALFRLHRPAPATCPSGWGWRDCWRWTATYWRSRRAEIAMRRGLGGARMMYRRQGIRVGVVAPWGL